MSAEVVDFRKPGRVPEDIGQLLGQWQYSAREAIELRWGRCIADGVKVEAVPPAPLTGSDLRTLDQSCVTFQMDVGKGGATTLLMICRSLAVALVGGVLGDSPEAMPEGRELTSIETTCLDFLIDEFLVALQSGQKLKPQRNLKVVGQVQLKALFSQFPANVTNTEVGFRVDLGFGSELIRWVLPQDVTLDFASSAVSEKTTDGETRKAVERLLLNAPGNLRVLLGGSQVSLAKLSDLKSGDIILLDQKIDDPLVAQFGSQQLFSGWGGRIGKQQAFQIEQVFEGQSEV